MAVTPILDPNGSKIEIEVRDPNARIMGSKGKMIPDPNAPMIKKTVPDPDHCETIGWIGTVDTYKIQRNGQLGKKREQLRARFMRAKRYTLLDAKKWERDELKKRDDIEDDVRRGKPISEQAPERTIEEMAEFYFQDESFTETEESTQFRARGIIERFLEWNSERGRPWASLWDEELAKAYIKDRRNGYRDSKGQWHNGHIGEGLGLQLRYCKKLFALELARKPSALTVMPWPAKVTTKKNEEEKVDPRPYSHEESDALYEAMLPNEKLVFSMLSQTGVRAEELLKLRTERIEFVNGRPTSITLTKTKNHVRRSVTLAPQGQEAVLALLGCADNSGYLVQRDFVTTKPGKGSHEPGGKRNKNALGDSLWRIKKRAVEKHPEFRHAFFDRVNEAQEGKTKPRFITCVHSFRATFVTELALAGVSLAVIAQLVGDKPSTLDKYLGKLKLKHEEAVSTLRPLGGYAQPGLEHLEKFEESAEYQNAKLAFNLRMLPLR
jgi:integrase